jgi:hypothetical protein
MVQSKAAGNGRAGKTVQSKAAGNGRAGKTVQSKQPVTAGTANKCVYIPSHMMGLVRKDGLSTVSDL